MSRMGSTGRLRKWGEENGWKKKEKKRKGSGRCNLGFNVADLVGEEGLDAGALGEALELPQLVQLQTQLLRRHLRGALGSSWRSFLAASRLFGAVRPVACGQWCRRSPLSAAGL